MPSLPSAATASPANPSSSSSATPRVELFDLMDSGELGQSSRFTDPRSSNIADVNQALDIYDKQYRSGQPKSLSGIAIRSLLLGISLASSSSLTIYLLASSSVLWRIPLFVASLALFHFLEFWTTAKYNTQSAEISSFLFSQNGSAYTIAHSAAIVECLLTNTLLSHPPWLPGPLNATLLSTGLILIAGGQITRSVAMIEAGTNFNHMVQYKKSRTHRLVTTGLYAHLRHPSYFGFFWWGLGTQLMLGNFFCLVGYAVVLWKFFSKRIDGEERLLVAFFGKEYVDYGARTRVGIPFIP